MLFEGGPHSVPAFIKHPEVHGITSGFSFVGLTGDRSGPEFLGRKQDLSWHLDLEK